jgi:predicted enzyme related to lactoylglutathione lyase
MVATNRRPGNRHGGCRTRHPPLDDAGRDAYRPGWEVHEMQGGLAWTELPGGLDCRATGRFYASVFGWAVDDDGMMLRFRDPDGVLTGAFICELPPAAAGGTILYLAVDSIDATLARAVDEGAQIVQPRAPIASGVGHRALLRDPAGSVIGLFEALRERRAA